MQDTSMLVRKFKSLLCRCALKLGGESYDVILQRSNLPSLYRCRRFKAYLPLSSRQWLLYFPNAPMTMHFRDPRLRNMSRTPLSPIPLARTDSFKFSYFPDATLLWNRLPTDVFAPPSLTLKLIFGLTFNCTFVLLCAVVVVVLFICLFVSCFGCVGTPLILALLSTGRSFALQCKIDIEKKVLPT